MLPSKHPVIDYLPHSVRRDIMITEMERMNAGYKPTVTKMSYHYMISRSAAQSILDKINEEMVRDE